MIWNKKFSIPNSIKPIMKNLTRFCSIYLHFFYLSSIIYDNVYNRSRLFYTSQLFLITLLNIIVILEILDATNNRTF